MSSIRDRAGAARSGPHLGTELRPRRGLGHASSFGVRPGGRTTASLRRLAARLNYAAGNRSGDLFGLVGGRKLDCPRDVGAHPGDRHRRARRSHSRPAATLPGTRPQGRRVPAHPRNSGPPAHRRRTRDVLGDVERALQLQVLEGAPALLRRDHHRGDARGDAGGHRRERRRRRHRRRLGGHLQGRIPQPPVLRRALPGRRDRRRRHRPRHHGDGRPPGCGDGPAAVRRRRRARHPPRRRRRGPRHRWIRKLAGTAQYWRRDGIRRFLCGQPVGERAVRRGAAQGRSASGLRVGHRQQDHSVRGAHRPGRDRRRFGAGVGDVRWRRGRSRQEEAARRYRWATRSWRRSSSSAASSCTPPAW